MFDLLATTFRTREQPRAQNETDTIQTGQSDINQKLDEVFLVEFSDAIIHPRAMMVHFTNAAFAHTTMMGSGRTIGFASATYGPVLAHVGISAHFGVTVPAIQVVSAVGHRRRLLHVREVHLHSRQWHDSRIRHHGPRVREDKKEEKNIEHNHVKDTP